MARFAGDRPPEPISGWRDNSATASTNPAKQFSASGDEVEEDRPAPTIRAGSGNRINYVDSLNLVQRFVKLHCRSRAHLFEQPGAHPIETLCQDLVSERGQASGTAIALEISNRYRAFTHCPNV